jgi:hypothetical protein
LSDSEFFKIENPAMPITGFPDYNIRKRYEIQAERCFTEVTFGGVRSYCG